MVNFKTLRVRTPEERAADEAARVAADQARETAEREAKVKHTRTVTLENDGESRFTMDGGVQVHFAGTDEQGRPIRGAFESQPGLDEAVADALRARFVAGAVLTMRGYFRPWTPTQGPLAGKTQFRFVGLFLAD